MGAKLSKRGSYSFKEDLKNNKCERRAISFISLSSSQIYGDLIEDEDKHNLRRSQSVPQVNRLENNKTLWHEDSVMKRPKLTRQDNVMSASKSLEEFLTQLQTIEEDCTTSSEDENPVARKRMNSYNYSDDDIFYDAEEFYDIILSTADSRCSTRDRQSQLRISVNTLEEVGTQREPSEVGNKVGKTNLPHTLSRQLVQSTPDILIHSLEVKEDGRDERSLSRTGSRDGSLEKFADVCRVEQNVHNSMENENICENKATFQEEGGVRITEELLDTSNNSHGVPSDSSNTSFGGSISHLDVVNNPTGAGAVNQPRTTNSEQSDLGDLQCDYENESISQIKLIMLEVNQLKIQIEENTNCADSYRSLMKIMMDVNSVKNEDFDENVIAMQNDAFAEIRDCLNALKFKNE